MNTAILVFILIVIAIAIFYFGLMVGLWAIRKREQVTTGYPTKDKTREGNPQGCSSF